MILRNIMRFFNPSCSPYVMFFFAGHLPRV